MESGTIVRAAVARRPGADFDMEDLRLALPRPDEVAIRVSGVGICHTDLVARDQIIPVPLPIVLGHEAAGIVEAVGAQVTDLSPGDKVVVSYSACGECRTCGEHEPAYCEKFGPLNFLGRRMDGSTALSDENGPIGSHFFGQSSFCERIVAPRQNLVKVETQLPLSLLGPLGCGIQTGAGAIMHSLDCQAGSSVAIFGAGSVGMAAVLAAVARRCATIVVVEPHRSRRELALELGATHAIDPTRGDPVAAVRAIRPEGLEFSLDVTGVPAAIEAAIGVLMKRGTCALVGAPQKAGQVVPLRFGMFVQNGHRLVGVMEGDSNPESFIPKLLELQAAGQFPFEKLLTTYPFHAINQAIADQAAGLCLKPVLLMGDDQC